VDLGDGAWFNLDGNPMRRQIRRSRAHARNPLQRFFNARGATGTVHVTYGQLNSSHGAVVRDARCVMRDA